MSAIEPAFISGKGLFAIGINFKSDRYARKN